METDATVSNEKEQRQLEAAEKDIEGCLCVSLPILNGQRHHHKGKIAAICDCFAQTLVNMSYEVLWSKFSLN